RDELRNGFRDFRIIDGILAVRAEIADRVALLAKMVFELLFELEAAVVRTESDRRQGGGDYHVLSAPLVPCPRPRPGRAGNVVGSPARPGRGSGHGRG